MTGRLLTTRRVSEILGVTPETILRWIETRGLPAHRLTSRAIRYDEGELDRWLLEHATGAADRGVSATRPNRAHGGGYAPLSFPVSATPPPDAASTEEEA